MSSAAIHGSCRCVIPQLQSERLILRAWEDRDRAPYATLATDAIAMQYLMSRTRQETPDQWINRQIVRFAEIGFAYWAVEARETGDFVGAVGLSPTNYEAHFTPAFQVGWRLLPRYWGNGYATEAAAAALRHGFADRQLEEIVAVTVPGNLRSQQVMRRLGMTHDPADDFDHPRLPEGDPLRRHILFRQSQADWQTRQR